MIVILMMLAKLATLGLLKVKLFQNKGYEVIISVHDVPNKIISRESNYTADSLATQTLGLSSIIWDWH